MAFAHVNVTAVERQGLNHRNLRPVGSFRLADVVRGRDQLRPTLATCLGPTELGPTEFGPVLILLPTWQELISH